MNIHYVRRVHYAAMLRRLADRIDPTPMDGNIGGMRSRLRREVYGLLGFRCIDCGDEFPQHTDPYQGENIDGLTLGHVIPASMGGPYISLNLVPQCKRCNEMLSDRPWTPDWFLKLLARKPLDPQFPIDDAGRLEWLSELQNSLRKIKRYEGAS